MSRGLTAGMLSELNEPTVRPFLLVELEFTSGLVNIWSGIGDLLWDSKTWQGVATLGTISPIEDTTDVRSTGLTFSLSGIPSAMISLALGELQRGKSGKVWLGFMDDAGAVISDPYLAFAGRIDTGAIVEDGATSTISIQAENRLVDLQRPRERRYTHEDQQSEYPDDLGFEYIAGLQDKQIKWGRS